MTPTTWPRWARWLPFVLPLVCSQVARAESGVSLPFLSASTSLERARIDLASKDDERARRALRSLASNASPDALDLLARSVLPGGRADTAELSLLAVRGLANHADHKSVRRGLVVVMANQAEQHDKPLAALVRGVAALALAASGNSQALAALVRAVQEGGPRGQAASLGLATYPPQHVEALLVPAPSATVHFIKLLDTLGDQRTFAALRDYAVKGTVPVRAAAAVALARHGSTEAIELAHHWQKDSQVEFRMAALEILFIAHAPGVAAAFAAALADDETKVSALKLARAHPSRSLDRPLIELLSSATGEHREAALVSLMQTATKPAVEYFARALAAGARPSQGAHALSQLYHEAAERALEHAAGNASNQVRLMALRGLTMFNAKLQRGSAELIDQLRRLSRSKSDVQRAVGAWGLAALAPGQALDLASSDDWVVLAALSRNSHQSELACLLAERLAHTDRQDLRQALAPTLFNHQARRIVPTVMLRKLLDAPGIPSELVVQAIAERARSYDPLFTQLTKSPSTSMRAALALGFGEAPAPFATARLASMYEIEASAVVRRAILRALGRRVGAGARSLLQHASRFDPDPACRRIARLGLGRGVSPTTAAGSDSLWLELRGLANTSGGQSLVLQSEFGDVRVVLPDPDGFVGVVGLAGGGIRYTIESESN